MLNVLMFYKLFCSTVTSKVNLNLYKEHRTLNNEKNHIATGSSGYRS